MKKLHTHIFSYKLMLLMAAYLFLPQASFGQTRYEGREEVQKIDKSVKISGSMQFWMRYADLNPGSMIHGMEEDHIYDLSIRRYRLKFSGQPDDKIRYSLEFGNNDLSTSNYNSHLPRLLEANVDYELNPHIALGLGKQAWTGLSRYAAPSTTQALAYDADFVAAPFVNIYDDILRRVGVYARGTFGGFDYRVSLAKPAADKSSNHTIGENAQVSDRGGDYQVSTYVKYQFLETESQSSPFSPGTYLGRKDLLNIGVGTLHQPDATWSVQTADTIYYQAKSLAVDLFFETRLSKHRGITLYLAYIKHDLGNNFMRFVGANNPATGTVSTPFINGKGNGAPVVGSGRIYYIQTAYIRPLDYQNRTQLQPYFSLAYSRFDALGIPVMTYNAGFNCYLNGQRSKVTLGFQSRPVLKQTEHKITEEMRKKMLVVQYQVLFGG